MDHGHFSIGSPLELSRYLASFSRYLAPKLRQQLLHDDVINDVIRPGWPIHEEHIDTPHIQEHCIKISSNSDKNCRKRSILKKNHDVTTMTSSGHVTSSESCPIDRPWPLSYGLSFGTIPLSGFVSKIFSAKVATTIIMWWRHQWRHKAHVNYPWGTYRHTTHRNIVLKYRPIPTRIAGEAFLKNHDVTIMTSSGNVTL